MKIPKANIILLSILLWMSSFARGQQPNTNDLVITFANNAFRAGDACELKELTWTQNIWDLTETQSLSKHLKERIEGCAPDTIVCLREGNRYYYQSKDNTQYLIGTENNQELVRYDLPERTMSYPFQLHDSICGYFHGMGKFCDRLFLRKCGSYKTKYEQLAALFLPDGNIIKEAAVVRTVRLLATLSAPIDTISQNDVYSQDSIENELANNPSLEKEETYRIYAKGYRYPIVESFCKKVVSSDSVIYQRIFYRSAESQEFLPLDESNQNIRRNAQNLDSQTESSFYYTDDIGKETSTFQINYNNSSHQLSVSSTNASAVDVTLILSDNQGRVYKQSKGKVTLEVPVIINCAGMPTGQYILYINQNSNTINIEKFNIK